MKKTGLSLFLFVLVSLVCSLAPGNVLANEPGMPTCCFNEPEAEPEIIPIIESMPVTEIANEPGMPTCCFNEPVTDPV